MGDLLRFLPAFGAILGLFWVRQNPFFWMMAGQFAFLLLCVYGFSRRRLAKVEEWARVDMDLARASAGTADMTDVIALAVVALGSGLVCSAIKHDIRGLVVTFSLCGLLGVGVLLRWWVFERWFAKFS